MDTATEEQDNLDFAQMLDSYKFDEPKRGEIIKGLVLEVRDDEIIVDVGSKRDAIVPRRDLDNLSEEIRSSLGPGDEIMVYVIRQVSDGDLLVSISKALTLEDWDRATALSENDEVIDVEIIGANKGGVLATFGRLRGFVPNSQLANAPRTSSIDKLNAAKNDLIGQTIKVKVIEVNQRRNRLVMSETAAAREVREDLFANLDAGQVIEGTVVGLAEYGAFVDIGDGVHGLIHISKLDWQHVNHPSEILSIGDLVKARIDQIDVERERISLNRQVVLPDPWDDVEEQMAVGTLVEGTISSVAEYGIFLELPMGITGLVHVSEMASYNIQDPRKWAKEGDVILVRVISIDADRKRIGLSLDAVEQEELHDWMIKRGNPDETALVGQEELDDEDDEIEPDDTVETEPEADTELEFEDEVTDENAE
nr:S1 RNA-binding domain-containing protein [Anaerolineae bacterium]